jgi:zinc protease
VETAFTVLEDWAHGVTLNADDIDKERAIILEEARVNKGAGERLRKALAPKLLNGSRYAQREPIGKEDVIRNAQPEALRRFYRDWYRPDLMAVIVVGDIEPAEAERLVKAHFAGLVNPPQPRARTYPEIGARTQTEPFVFTDEEMPGSAVNLSYPVRFEPELGTYGSYRAKVVDGLATILLNLRLAEQAQQANPPFLGAGAHNMPVTARHKAFFVEAALGAGGVAPAIASVEQELHRIRHFGFSEAEVERARKMMLNAMEGGLKQRDTTESGTYVAEYQRNFLANESIPGIEAEVKVAQELLPGITVADLNAAARKAYPADGGKLVVFAGNTKAGPAPTTAQLLAADAAAAHATVTDRAEKKVAQRLMERPATPGRIVAETRDETLGLTRLTLSNGVQVILKPTAFHKDEVLLGARRYGGQTLVDAKDLPNARAASGLAMSMGLKDFAPTDLMKMLAGRRAGVTLGMSDYTDEIAGQSASGPEDLETMFQMLWLRFDGVRRDENLYKAFMGGLGEMVRNRAAAPEQRFAEAVTDTLYGRHPYEGRLPTQDDIAKIDLDRSLAIYRQRFASAKGLTFVVVGDFDPAAIKPLVTAYLGTLPTPDLPLAYRDVGLRIAKGVVKKEVRAGTEPKSVVSLTFAGPAAWSPAEALKMSALIEVMNLRVNTVLREKLGLIYTGQMAGAVHRIPYQHYEISTQLPTGPEKVDQLVAALFAEIDNIKANGPTQAELDKVKANWRVSNERARHENGYWLQNLQLSLLEGTPMARLLTVMDEADAITAADVRTAAQRYFDKDNYVQVVLLPEAGERTASK